MLLIFRVIILIECYLRHERQDVKRRKNITRCHDVTILQDLEINDNFFLLNFQFGITTGWVIFRIYSERYNFSLKGNARQSKAKQCNGHGNNECVVKNAFSNENRSVNWSSTQKIHSVLFTP